jgi:hypothetical protein
MSRTSEEMLNELLIIRMILKVETNDKKVSMVKTYVNVQI